MKNFCECCSNNNEWVMNHIDPEGTLSRYSKAEDFRSCFEIELTDVEINAINEYIKTL